MIVFEDVVSRLSSFNIIMRCSPRASHQCLGVTRILPWQPGLGCVATLVSGQYHPMADVSVRPGVIMRVSIIIGVMIAGCLQLWSQLCVCLTLSDVTSVSMSSHEASQHHMR